MGEARRRTNTLSARLLKDGAVCVFCGGAEPATQVDHVPARSVFLGRRRPSGLEFPACSACNNGFSDTDVVVALLSRISSEGLDEEGKADLAACFKAAERRVPGLMAEMRPLLPRQSARLLGGAGQFRVMQIGPLVRRHLVTFGTKLALALHYQRTGAVVSNDDGVYAQVFTNFDWISGIVPPEMTSWSQNPRTLVQGKLTAGDQFVYDWIAEADGSLAMYVASFRNSFAVAGYVSSTPAAFERLGAAYRDRVMRPSDVQAASQTLRADAQARRARGARTERYSFKGTGTLGHSLLPRGSGEER